MRDAACGWKGSGEETMKDAKHYGSGCAQAAGAAALASGGGFRVMGVGRKRCERAGILGVRIDCCAGCDKTN